MTGKKFLFYWFLDAALFVVLKICLFHYDIFSNFGLQQTIFWILSAVLGAALVRRFGVINYLESLFVIIVWTLSGIFLDLLITSAYTGLAIFYLPAYWAGFIAMDISILLTHKKRHIHVRHELHAREHGQKHS